MGDKKYQIIWYDLDGEKKRETINNCIDDADATSKAYLKYGGADNAPAKLLTVIEITE